MSSIQKAGRRTESISEAVGEVVAAIQFHDNMNQRIQHIQQNFRDIENACNGAVAERKRKNGGSNSCDKMFSILLLQTGQIQQILTDLTEIRSGLEDAFTRIDSEIEGLTKILSEFEAETGRRGTDASRTVEKPMSNLSRAMTTLFSLVDKSDGLIEEVFEAAALVSDTIGQLTEYMDEIRRFSYDTHLMALNAIVKSGHLDEHGRTLEVLSQEMVRLSRDAAVFVGDVEDINQMILQSTSDLTQQHAQAPAKKETARADVLTEINETTESVAHISSTASEEAESIRRTIDGIRTGLTFIDPLTETLTRVRASLNRLASVVGTTPDRPEGLTLQETMELAKRYTMQKERDVHRQITGEAFSSESPDRVPAQNKGKTPEPPPEDLGENVELF
jgi:methyl-accepting chemotaxis protein